ncbi:MAG: PilZ domain-containing protein [Deltaproteobacteria bacterium]|nr:PilZ domain-containing protein [Deltaproteobacteria bacterium]MBW2413004.1 PilZ domain-containing protein [Deltaproteobacteria bacterium]
MSTPPSVLLLDDGELDRFAAALRHIGVDFVHLRGRQIGAVVECPTDLLIASLPRTVEPPELEPPATSTEYPIRICVHQQDFLPLRERLRKLGTHFLIHSQVDSESLRLLVLQILHQGAEQRGAQRLPFGSEVIYWADGDRHTGLLSELSVESCRLVTGSPLRPDTPVRLKLPRELVHRAVELTALAVRCTPCELSQDLNGYNVVLEFSNVAHEVQAMLEQTLAGRQLGTRVTPLSPVPTLLDRAESKPEDGDPDDEEVPEIMLDRRRHDRHLYARRIAALTTGNADAPQVVLGRDLSISGIRIAQHPDLEVGSRLALAIYGSEGSDPVVLEAQVANDMGDEGLGLRFTGVTAANRRDLETVLGELPALETLDGENTHPDRLFLSKVLPSKD